MAFKDADALIAAGQPLEDSGDFEGALHLYNRAIMADPGNPRPYMNAGNALAHLEQWDNALAAFRRAVACSPKHAPARFNLGSLLYSRGAFRNAELELLVALELDPGMVSASIMLADLYETEGRFEAAEEQFQRALGTAPNNAGAALNFGWYYVRQGRIEEALQRLQQARSIDPTITAADSQILFAMNFKAELTVTEIAAEHKRYGNNIAERGIQTFSSWPNTSNPDRLVRIGYVSGDFGPHPVGFFIRPILQNHDRSKFEIYCYSNARDDQVVERVSRQSDHWRMIANLDDQELCERIRDDQIDILVDLAGHTDRGRLLAFARHPAPLQVTWLGYLNTTGLRAMDYRIVDGYTDPVGSTEHLNTEQLIRLPHSQWCYYPWHEVEVVGNPHPDRRGIITFGSFNQYAKLTDKTLALWSRIFRRLPNWELIVFDVRHRSQADLLLRRMLHHHIDIARVEMRGRVPVAEYLKAIGNVDIALDTMPYNGATTTLDVLWMGVPIVGLYGDRGVSRSSYSILKALGLSELVADSEDELVAINLELAHSHTRRHLLRDTLRKKLLASPLMDAPRFTRELEAVYLKIWHRWCRRGM